MLNESKQSNTNRQRPYKVKPLNTYFFQSYKVFLVIDQFLFLFWRLELRCWLINCRRCQLRSQRSAGTLASNQLLPNATLECDGKALIDLVDSLSSGSVLLVSMTNGNLADHDARLGGGAAERLPGHVDQAQTIA